jgi:hypothetical protein
MPKLMHHFKDEDLQEGAFDAVDRRATCVAWRVPTADAYCETPTAFAGRGHPLQHTLGGWRGAMDRVALFFGGMLPGAVLLLALLRYPVYSRWTFWVSPTRSAQ